ncbi:MAG: hypothetical protein Q9171_002538 [Xanthocarpia ochracea]
MKKSTIGVENNLKRLSVLSRFTIPNAAKKPRNVSEYGIELDDPYKTFAPGDRIRGQVVLNVERPVRITHLTICLHGVVKVLKNGRIQAESISRWRSYLATGQGKWGEAYFGNGLAALFKDEVILAGDGCLTASLYKFNFDLELPTHDLPSSVDQMQASPSPSSAISETSDESPQSPSASDISHISTFSGEINDPERGSAPLGRHVSANADRRSVASSDEAMLNPTATVTMLQSGCLPGDVISVKVSINLGKSFKNPQGIILTLYRECHIDLHPAIPLGSWQDGKKQQYEDYYPRSRTGLGGLSLSSAGSSRVFRQDINQKTTALYVDRRTLAADVKASVQVPDGVFPTISSVPGAMIDFKYYVEAVIDLRAKSAIQERILPRLSMVNPVPSFGPGESRFNPDESYDTVKPLVNPGLSFFETSQMRRDKGVVTHVAEIIVGTKDSERSRPKKADSNEDHIHSQKEVSRGRNSVTDSDACDGWQESGGSHPYAENVDHGFDGYPEDPHTIDFAPAHDIPPPEVEDQVDEKTRLQRAEELLLPSSPLQEGGGESSWRENNTPQPTAPAPFDDDDLPDFDQPGPSAPAYDRPSSTYRHDSVALTSQSLGGNGDQEEFSHGSMEDKQELERRRLQAQASSPEGATVTNGVVHTPDVHATAPVLDEDISGVPSTPQHGAEHLPTYQA